MKEHRAREILTTLVQGIDPLSGEEIPPDTVLQQVDVLRALLAGLTALEHTAARAQRRSQLPGNVGHSWSKEEEATVIAAFKSNESIAAIATRQRRTKRAIEARLTKLGLLTPAQGSPDNGFIKEPD